jgi:hypothetical protein
VLKIKDLLQDFTFDEGTGRCELKTEAPRFKELQELENGFKLAKGWDYHFLYRNLATNCDFRNINVNVVHFKNWKKEKETFLSKYIGDLGKNIPITGNDRKLERYLRIYIGFGYVLKTLKEEGVLTNA